MKAIVLQSPPHDPNLVASLFGHLLGEGWEVAGYADQSEVPDEVAADAEVIIPVLAPVDASLIKRCPSLRLIQVPGHGYEHVSVADARAAGVPVATVASSGAEAHTVAEWAILLAGAASRRLVEGHEALRSGEWATARLIQAGVFELAGKTLGIVGLGRIGREVAKRARAFDMRLIYFDPIRPGPGVEQEFGVEYRELEQLLAEADVVTIHVPLTGTTRHLIGEREIGLMKPQAILVNTARGALVDAGALAAALREGRLRAAALDVWDPEPPGSDHPLVGLEDVVMSPHMAGVTAESVMRIFQAAAANCNRMARGEEPLDVVEEGAEH